MRRFYLVAIETNGKYRGPKYFSWRFDPDPPALVDLTVRWSLMDYGFMPYALVLAHDIGQTDHDNLLSNPDVYSFPENLDAPVTDPNIDAFFEAINIPVDWLTPATTYLELLRNTAGMFQFNQRYAGIYAMRDGGQHSIFDNATLASRLRQMSAEEQAVFLETAESLGIDPGLINTNSQLRLLVRQAANLWQNQPFIMGGFSF